MCKYIKINDLMLATVLNELIFCKAPNRVENNLAQDKKNKAQLFSSLINDNYFRRNFKLINS
jgi:hypothetical protein